MPYTRTWRQVFRRRRPGSTIGRVDEAVTHTEAGAHLPASASVDQEIRRFKAIDAYHRSLGWSGFGYSAMVCLSGRYYEGRGYKRSGAHTRGHNRTTLAYVVPGNGDRTPMTDAAIAAAGRWIAEGIEAGAFTPDPEVSGHRDYSTKSCPGHRIYPQLGRVKAAIAPSADPTEEDDGMFRTTKDNSGTANSVTMPVPPWARKLYFATDHEHHALRPNGARLRVALWSRDGVPGRRIEKLELLPAKRYEWEIGEGIEIVNVIQYEGNPVGFAFGR